MDSPPTQGESLLAAYRRWKSLQEAPAGSTEPERRLGASLAKVGADYTATEIAKAVRAREVAKAANAVEIERAAKARELEARAFRKSVEKVALAADGGADPSAALLFGFKCYRKKGGSDALETWRRRVAAG